MSTRARRALMLVAVAAIGATTLAVPTRASASAAAPAKPFCGITWGSLAKAHAATAEPNLTTTRTGRHDCYDRVVFEFEGTLDGYRVEYVDQVRTEPDGWVLPVAGGARLQLTLWADIVDETGRWTYPADLPHDLTGYKTLRDLKVGGSNEIGHLGEWHTTFGIGVRARLPFRAFVLAGPGTHSRLVIDVAHRW
ncbi:MAG TPA: hypothetical protein VF244_09920 [Acidimicrobiales bacterium]